MPRVAFDESGNTGQNLLDRAQPIFTLAAVRLEDGEIEMLRELVDWPEDEELHFTDLKNSGAGRDRILRILHSEIADPAHVKTYVMHKRYMVVTEVVDLLVEPLTHRTGFNLYERGGNIALANLLAMCLPTFCGQDRYEAFLNSFVTMVRDPDEDTVASFYRDTLAMRRACSHTPFLEQLNMLLATQFVLPEVLDNVRVTTIDPAIPAFVALAAEWDKELGEPWEIIHDDSKPVEREKEILETITSESDQRETIQFGRATATFPLQVTGGIQLKSSKQYPEIQIADVFAGAANHHIMGHNDPAAQDPLWESFPNDVLFNLTAGAVWPDPEIDPEKLGTEDMRGSPPDEMGELIGRRMAEKYGEDWHEKYQRGELSQ